MNNAAALAVSPTREWDNPGPFDIIGDVHGCRPELEGLLAKLGYVRAGDPGSDEAPWSHPDGRQAVFLGDITDRGPDSVGVIRVVTAMVGRGAALYVPGNHCRKQYRYLTGHQVMLQHGIETTVAEYDRLPPAEREAVTEAFRTMYEGASVHLVLDYGRLVVAHAGLREEMIGQTSKRVTRFCLFGDTTGEQTPDGLPVRRDWAREYEGDALVVYGHTPVEEAVFRHNTVNIDQGCVFGGRLTALRYPERQLVHVAAQEVYDPSGVFAELTP